MFSINTARSPALDRVWSNCVHRFGSRRERRRPARRAQGGGDRLEEVVVVGD